MGNSQSFWIKISLGCLSIYGNEIVKRVLEGVVGFVFVYFCKHTITFKIIDLIDQLFSKRLFLIAQFFLLFSAGAGVLIRYTQTFGISRFEIGKWVQGHSHVAFLGWGFLGVMHLLNQKTKFHFQKIDIFFYVVLILSLLGMMVFFPLFGYKLIPILFLVIFLLASYGLLFRFYLHLKHIEIAEKQWFTSAIICYFLSSVTIWLIPVVMVKMGKSDLYYNLIYFYLHFLYNGFFTFALWGMLFQKIRNDYNLHSPKAFKTFFFMMQMAVIPTYILSLYWNPISNIIQMLGILSASIQIIAVLILLKSLVKQAEIVVKNFTLLLIVGIFATKILMQFLSSFYTLSAKAIALKPYFVVGYLHWFTIGFLTFTLLYLSELTQTKYGKRGFMLLVIGFFITEFILFYQGTALLMDWNENLLPYSGLFYGSLLMFVGILAIFFTTFKSFKNKSL